MKSTQSILSPAAGTILREPLFHRVLVVSLAVHGVFLAFSLIITWHLPTGNQPPRTALPAIVQTTAVLAPSTPVARPAQRPPMLPSRPVQLVARSLPAASLLPQPLSVALPAADPAPLAEPLARALACQPVAATRTATVTTRPVPARVLPSYQYPANPHPQYPRLARRRGWQGTTVLTVEVSTTGRADTVTVERSSGYRVLDRAAVDTVRHWQFRPGRVGEATVAMLVRVPIIFQLADS